MPNNTNKNFLISRGIQAAVFVVACIYQTVSWAELSTLFTTPQERLIINANRYKSDEIKTPRIVEVHGNEEIRELVRENVKKSFLISGITISNEGNHSVWINGQVYEDGEKVEGKSRVNVIVGNAIKVRITTPDGKQHYGAIGETVEVSYQEASDS